MKIKLTKIRKIAKRLETINSCNFTEMEVEKAGSYYYLVLTYRSQEKHMACEIEGELDTTSRPFNKDMVLKLIMESEIT